MDPAAPTQPVNPQAEQISLSADKAGFFRTPAALYGLTALLCLGLISFFAVYSYMVQVREAEAQAAAAAAVQIKPNPFEGIAIQGTAAYVIDLSTGEVLYEKNANTQLPLASITKVALALAVDSALSRDARITIPYDTAPAARDDRLNAGEKWTVADIITFTLVSSSNNAAEILASAAENAIRERYAESRNEPTGMATVWRMNQIAKELGLTNTYFLNASGLDLSMTQSGAYSSARDIGQLMAYAAKDKPELFSGTARGNVLLNNEQGATAPAHNTNEALGDIPGLIMGKTGFTDLAGGNLAIVFDVGFAHPVAAVVLGSTFEGRFSDMKKLVEAAHTEVTQ